MTHTPGPWTVDDVWIEANGDTVAEVWADGDACLIAAAPDLLAALKIAEGYIHLWMEHNTGRNELNDLEAVEQAIAKAEGRAELHKGAQ
jgi:hypothetical protein